MSHCFWYMIDFAGQIYRFFFQIKNKEKNMYNIKEKLFRIGSLLPIYSLARMDAIYARYRYFDHLTPRACSLLPMDVF